MNWNVSVFKTDLDEFSPIPQFLFENNKRGILWSPFPIPSYTANFHKQKPKSFSTIAEVTDLSFEWSVPSEESNHLINSVRNKASRTTTLYGLCCPQFHHRDTKEFQHRQICPRYYFPSFTVDRQVDELNQNLSPEVFKAVVCNTNPSQDTYLQTMTLTSKRRRKFR